MFAAYGTVMLTIAYAQTCVYERPCLPSYFG